MAERILRFGLLKERRRGIPRTEEERKARHEAIFGKRAVLPERGAGLGPLGFGILPNIQKRIQEIIKK